MAQELRPAAVAGRDDLVLVRPMGRAFGGVTVSRLHMRVPRATALARSEYRS